MGSTGTDKYSSVSKKKKNKKNKLGRTLSPDEFHQHEREFIQKKQMRLAEAQKKQVKDSRYLARTGSKMSKNSQVIWENSEKGGKSAYCGSQISFASPFSNSGHQSSVQLQPATINEFSAK